MMLMSLGGNSPKFFFSAQQMPPGKDRVAKEGHGEHFLSYFRLVFLVTFRGENAGYQDSSTRKGRTGSS